MERVDLLREKVNFGTASEVEIDEYKEFVEAVDVISILQAKARLVLNSEAA